MRNVLRLVPLLLVIVLGACRVDTTVAIDVTADGSGTVAVEAVFDAAATSALGGLQEGLLIDDLAGAGWSVEPIDSRGDGTTVLLATKEFADQTGLANALDEIAGPGVFNDVELTAGDTFAERRQALSMNIDLSEGWGLFSDDGVAASLDGEPFGVPITSLTDGRPIDDVVSVTVTTTIDAATDGDDGTASASYTPRFDDPDATAVVLEASVESSSAVLVRWIAWALTALAALSCVLFVLGLFVGWRAEGRAPVPTPGRLASRIPGAADAAGPSARSAGAGGRHVQMVVVEPRTVLLASPIDHVDEIVAFAAEAEQRSMTSEQVDELRSTVDEVVCGRRDHDEVWRVVGLSTRARADIDDRFGRSRVVRRSTSKLLRDLSHAGVRIAAVSNDVDAWAEASRLEHRLHDVWPWLVSSSLGAAKPDTGMFERLRREANVAYRNCLYVDTDVTNLDAAKELGMRTALLSTPEQPGDDAHGHPVVKDLSKFVRSLAGSR